MQGAIYAMSDRQTGQEHDSMRGLIFVMAKWFRA